MTTKQIGDRGEDLAVAYLEADRYIILERNYRFERAEVDIVAFRPFEDYTAGGELVFVEVKTRTGLGYGHPEEAVTEAKKLNLIKAAKAYLHEFKLEGSPCRFDVISIVLQGSAEPDIKHFENAFWVF
ncbi:MAG: YraN family protein [Bacteroidota bacterium]